MDCATQKRFVAFRRACCMKPEHFYLSNKIFFFLLKRLYACCDLGARIKISLFAYYNIVFMYVCMYLLVAQSPTTTFLWHVTILYALCCTFRLRKTYMYIYIHICKHMSVHIYTLLCLMLCYHRCNCSLTLILQTIDKYKLLW